MNNVSLLYVVQRGRGLWYNRPSLGGRIESKPLRKNHEEQIELVETLSWLTRMRYKVKYL